MKKEPTQVWYLKQDRGFHAQIPEATARIYFKALLVCANGDGTLTDAERAWVLGFASVLDASDGLIDELSSYTATDEIKDLLSSDDSVNEHGRRALIYDAIQACDADDHYHEGERASVHKMAELMGVDQEVVTQLEELQQETKKLRRRRIELLFPGGTPY